MLVQQNGRGDRTENNNYNNIICDVEITNDYIIITSVPIVNLYQNRY